MRGAARGFAEQLEGVVAQVAFGVPVMLGSVLLARLGYVSLVADFALATALSATVFTALSFGLRPMLALRGTAEVGTSHFGYWQSRLWATAAGCLVSVLLGLLLGVASEVAVAVALVKACDSIADLSNGFHLVQGSPRRAARLLLRWSALRAGMFLGGATLAFLLGSGAGTVVLAGGVAQAGLLGASEVRAALRPGFFSLRELWALSRPGIPYSVAGIACAILVTAPRGVAAAVLAEAELGYAGVAFVAATVAGMSFNVVWLRSAVLARQGGYSRVRQRLVLEGGLVAVAVMAAVVLMVDLVAFIFDVPDPRFHAVFVPTTIALVFTYYAMSYANILKMARWRLAEAVSYLLAAGVLVLAVRVTHSLALGTALGAAALFLAVELFSRSRLGLR